MKYSKFETTVHGKWLLAGEHAVLRGIPALVFPVFDKSLTLSFNNNQHSEQDLIVNFDGVYADELRKVFWKALKYALSITEIPIKKVIGKMNIENDIPLGAGLGLSAAICAAISRWLASQDCISKENINDFAHNLEHIFHGESSGVDIAGVTAKNGILFKHGEENNSIEQTWSPNWYLSYTEEIGITSKCIKAVKDIWQANLPLAKRIDELMLDSVNLALEALQSPKKVGIKKLANAINTANNCFVQWGLTTGKVENHIHKLLKAGALAAKPTGSGNGGYVLSLWDGEPPEYIKSILTPA
ncbi:MAG: mevalonate kinase [Legionellales bacterium]|nr:mevalonate kinase [Legionellales bacterium]